MCESQVSTQEQKKHGLSVDNQIEALTEYCKEKGYAIHKVYNDAGRSGHASYQKRPELLQLIRDCQSDLVDIILFTRIDRWFRSIKDYYLVQDQIKGVPWKAIWEDYETETSSGQFKVNIMLSVAEAEASRTSEKIKSVFEYKRAQGQHLGCIPYGYIRKDGHLYKDPEKEEVVNAVFKEFFRTHSAAACCRLMYNMGFNVSHHVTKRIIYGTAYYGDANGSPCEPYITKEQHDEIMKLKDKWTRKPKKNNVYLFSGLCICKYCGKRMRGAATCPDKKDYYINYYCRGHESVVKHIGLSVSISEKKVERYLLENLDTLVTQNSVSILASESSVDKLSILEEKAKLERKLERVGIRFEDGDYTVEEYRQKKRELMDQINSLVIPAEAEKKPVSLPDGWQNIYSELDKEGRREFWFSILESIIIEKDKYPQVIFL